MREILPKDRQKVISLLTAAFVHNRSVNYIINGRNRKESHIRGLMEFALAESRRAKGAFISENEKGALLFTRPKRQERISAGSVLASLKFIFTVTGIFSLQKVLKREKYIKNKHPEKDFIYLWFVGISPDYQKKEHVSILLSELILLSDRENLPVCLETSTPENIPFYERHGFSIYHEWNCPKAGFPLWFLRREALPTPDERIKIQG